MTDGPDASEPSVDAAGDVTDELVAIADPVAPDVPEPVALEVPEPTEAPPVAALEAPVEQLMIEPARVVPAIAVAEAVPAESPTPVAPPPDAVPPAVVPPVVVAPAAPASHVAKRRRRWPWVTALSILLILVLLAGAFLWYVSGLVGDGARVARPGEPFPMSILSNNGETLTYSGPDGGWVDQGLIGIATVEGGYVQTDKPSTVGTGDTATTTRTITKQVLPPAPAPGQASTLDGWYFPRNPLVGLGLEYEDVTYDSPAGPTPAWVIPGTSSTWVIFTHGRGATPLEGLRIANTTSALGYPTMLIKYRDDAKAPVEDGLGNFGATEWPDLQAAVQYALDHGAQKVVLAGASMGGSITLAFLQNSSLADRVSGAFLDSPLASFDQVVRKGASDLGLPDFATSAAMTVASWRYGFDFAATNYTADAAAFTTPMMIVQGTADETVPPAVAQDFAAAASPGVVQLEMFDGAGHVMSWNVDRPRYEKLLTDFLAKVAPSP